MFAFTTQHVLIEVPERTSDCAKPKTLKKFSYKKKKTHRNSHDEGKRDETDLALRIWLFYGETVRGSYDAGEICELRLHTVTCLASLHVGKQHRTNNESQNRIKRP